MATSAFTVNPTALSSAGPRLPAYRSRNGYPPPVKYVCMKDSEVYRVGDILKVTVDTATTPFQDQVERAVDPAGTDATATMQGTTGTPPRYYCLSTETAPATADQKDVIAVFDLRDIEVLFRLYNSTAASAEPQDFSINAQPEIPVGSAALGTLFHRFGIYEIGTGSDNYFPIIGAADATDGFVSITEIMTESGVGDDFGLAYGVFGGLA